MTWYRFSLFLWAAICFNTSSSEGSDLSQFSAILSQADVMSKNFQGEFICHSGESEDDRPLHFDLKGLKLQSQGRIWVESGNVVVEFLGGSEMTAVGKGSQYNDIEEVLALSDGTAYRFTAVGSTLTPYANLRIQDPGKSNLISSSINENILVYLKAITEIGGFPISSVLSVPNSVVRVDPSKGFYSVSAKYDDATNPASISYELTVVGSEVKCKSKLTTGIPARSLSIESLVEADLTDGVIIPRQVARRLSGPGYGVARREIMKFTPKELEGLKFPITSQFFRRYERNFAVLQGESQESSEYVTATPDKYMNPLHDRLNPTSKLSVKSSGSSIWMILLIANAILVVALFTWWYRVR